MNNPYKRQDVFSCNYETHAKFDYHVSVYHVMRSKKCYPQGCVMFKWDCERKKKGSRCPRGYDYVGRLCEGCTYYQDEKIHYQPRLLLSNAEFEQFLVELEEFEEWLSVNLDHDRQIWCHIDSVKPRFKRMISSGKGHFRLDGYLLVISHGFIGLDEFNDYFYVNITPRQQDRWRFAPGDSFDAIARFGMDRGRVVFHRLRAVDIEHRSGKDTWNNSQALVARLSAKPFSQQPEMCIRCRYGALVDTVEYRRDQKTFRRSLICLQGITDPQVCSVNAFEKIDMCPTQLET